MRRPFGMPRKTRDDPGALGGAPARRTAAFGFADRATDVDAFFFAFEQPHMDGGQQTEYKVFNVPMQIFLICWFCSVQNISDHF